MKKAAIIFIIIMVFFFGSNQAIKFYIYPPNYKEKNYSGGKLIYDPSISLVEIDKITGTIDRSFQIVDKELELKPEVDLDVIYFNSSGISYQNVFFNNIVFHRYRNYEPPFIHEYVHARLGKFKDEWFNEGYAVWWSLNVKKRNPDFAKSYQDTNDFFFKNKKVSSLTTKYNKEEFIQKFDLKVKDFASKSFKDKIEFYTASMFFCDYLIEQEGSTKILDIAKKRTVFKNSFSKLAQLEGINITDHHINWLNSIYK